MVADYFLCARGRLLFQGVDQLLVIVFEAVLKGEDAVLIDEAMLRGGLADKLALLVAHLVAVGETGTGILGLADVDGEGVAKACGGLVFDIDADHGGDDTLGLEVGIFDTYGRKEGHAGLFHILDIIGMVNHSHLVGLVVVDFADVCEHGVVKD